MPYGTEPTYTQVADFGVFFPMEGRWQGNSYMLEVRISNVTIGAKNVLLFKKDRHPVVIIEVKKGEWPHDVEANFDDGGGTLNPLLPGQQLTLAPRDGAEVRLTLDSPVGYDGEKNLRFQEVAKVTLASSQSSADDSEIEEAARHTS